MLREQKGRDHWGGSDVAVPLENISFHVIHSSFSLPFYLPYPRGGGAMWLVVNWEE